MRIRELLKLLFHLYLSLFFLFLLLFFWQSKAVEDLIMQDRLVTKKTEICFRGFFCAVDCFVKILIKDVAEMTFHAAFFTHFIPVVSFDTLFRNLWRSDVFRVYRKRTVAWNGLIVCSKEGALYLNVRTISYPGLVTECHECWWYSRWYGEWCLWSLNPLYPFLGQSLVTVFIFSRTFIPFLNIFVVYILDWVNPIH